MYLSHMFIESIAVSRIILSQTKSAGIQKTFFNYELIYFKWAAIALFSIYKTFF